jgi:cobalt/nickel transport protein
MKKNNLFIVAALLGLTILPLWWVARMEPAAGTEWFSGSDSQAQQMILALAPDYSAWFEPLWKPASGEIESLLFALQAALGGSFIGYWFGVSVTRHERRQSQPARLPDPSQSSVDC